MIHKTFKAINPYSSFIGALLHSSIINKLHIVLAIKYLTPRTTIISTKIRMCIINKNYNEEKSTQVLTSITGKYWSQVKREKFHNYYGGSI